MKKNSLIITDKEFYQAALKLIIPVVLQQVINQGVNMMDTIMVGQLGEVAISASSLANQFIVIYVFMIMGFSAAGLVLTSQYWGAGERQTVNRVFDLLIQLVIVASLLFGLVSFFIPEKIMRIYTADEAVIREGAKYLKVSAFIYILNGFSLLMTNLIRCIGNANLGFYVSCVSFVVNIGANYVFIFGKLGFPALGVQGAAVGTLCARAVEFAVTIIYLTKFEKKLHYRFKGLLKPPTRAMLSEFTRLGLPAIISDTILALSLSVIGMILGRMGTEYVSAYSIVNVMDRFCTIATSGVGMAAGVMVGQTVGAGDLRLAKRQGFSFLLMSTVLGLMGGLLVFVLRDWAISLYDIRPDTAEIARLMMTASASVLVFQSISSTLGKGVLRGGGDTQFLLVGDVIFQWIASIPLGILLGLKLKASPFLVLIAMRSDNIIKSIWFIMRMRTDKWFRKAKSQAEPEA